MSVSEELARLAELRDQGVLSEDEFRAQKKAVLAGNASDGSEFGERKKPKTAKAGCLSVVGILVLLFIIGAIFAPSKGSQSGSDAASGDTAKVEATPVTAQQLFDAYQANEASAQQLYGDKALRVSGRIASIDLDLTDDPVVMLRTSNEFMPVHAPLADQSKAKAATLYKGQNVELICSGVSEVVGTPMLKDCVL